MRLPNAALGLPLRPLAAAFALARMGIVWLTFGAVASGLVAVPLYWHASRRHLLLPRRELAGAVMRSIPAGASPMDAARSKTLRASRASAWAWA